MEPEGSIPNSQELSTCSYPEPEHVEMFLKLEFQNTLLPNLFFVGFLYFTTLTTSQVGRMMVNVEFGFGVVFLQLG
jgi:hypothetical protein